MKRTNEELFLSNYPANAEFNIQTGTSSLIDAANPGDPQDVTAEHYDQPAVLPRCTIIHVITRHSPWCLTVENEQGVTVRDLLSGLFTFYGDLITEPVRSFSSQISSITIDSSVFLHGRNGPRLVRITSISSSVLKVLEWPVSRLLVDSSIWYKTLRLFVPTVVVRYRLFVHSVRSYYALI